MLIRQYKHAVQEITTELPAGFVDPEDPTPLEAAQRELREETGFTGGDGTYFGRFIVSSSKATTRAPVFFAQEVKRTQEQDLDEQEDIEILLPTLEKFAVLIQTGKLCDLDSIMSYYTALRTLQSGA